MITLTTIIYEKNFDSVLSKDSLFFNLKSKFITEKILLINNITKEQSEKLIELSNFLKHENTILIKIENEINNINSFFNIYLDYNNLPQKYYCIPYFVGILKCKNDFLFNVSSDCIPVFEDDFFEESIKVLKENHDITSTTLPWRIINSASTYLHSKYNVGLDEENNSVTNYGKSRKELKHFYYSCFFSDQVFLINVNKMKKLNFNLISDQTGFYPVYGENSFEKRVCSSHFINDQFRLIFKKYFYVHEMFQQKRLILGDGLMGNYLQKKTGWDYLSRKKDNINFENLTDTHFEELKKYDIIINCIANTNTYSENKSEHWNINYVGTSKLVDFCVKENKKLIHFSTDYVYTFSKENASEEDVPVHCRTWYGYTKLLSDSYIELKMKESDYLIIRTTQKKHPFTYDQAYINQVGNFDYIHNIGNLCLQLILYNAYGKYNIGTETKTMYDLALKTKSDVVPTKDLYNENMPTNTTMNLNKMKLLL